MLTPEKCSAFEGATSWRSHEADVLKEELLRIRRLNELHSVGTLASPVNANQAVLRTNAAVCSEVLGD